MTCCEKPLRMTTIVFSPTGATPITEVQYCLACGDGKPASCDECGSTALTTEGDCRDCFDWAHDPANPDRVSN